MNKWYIKLAGNIATLRELSKAFKSGDLVISFDAQKDSFFLHSSEFEGLVNILDINERAMKIVAELNAPTKLAVGSVAWTEPIRVANVIEIKPDGSKLEHIMASLNVDLPLFDLSISIDGFSPIEEASQAVPVPKWVELQRTDKNVQRAFNVYSKRNLEWGDLYVIYEIIEDEIGNPCKKGWVSKGIETLFTHTANYYRHGKGKHKQPKEPMAIQQAKEFIERIFKQWLASKL